MANRYWVTGGNGNWSSTTNWSTASGGGSGASVPSTSDAAFFDASSGSGTSVLDISPTVQTINFTGFAGTFNFGSNNLSLNSTGTIFTGSTSMTVSGTPVVNCTNATSTARTVSPQTVTEANSISFNVTAGTGNFTVTSANTVKNLNFTGFTGTWLAVSCVLYGDLTVTSSMTMAAGGVVTFSSAAATQKITSNSINFDRAITINGTANTVQLQDNLTTGSTRTVTLTNGTLDLNSKTLSTGIFSSNNSNTRSVLFGTGNITLTGSGAVVFTVATATNLTFTGTPVINAIYSGSTGTRSFNCPTSFAEATAPSFNISAGSDIVSFGTTSRIVKSVNFTGFTGTLTDFAVVLYGNLTIASGMTLTASANTTTFSATSGRQQITTAGKTIDNPIKFDDVGGTWSFADALTQGSTRAFTITNGTIKLKNGVTSTVGVFTAAGANQTYLQSSSAGSQATLSQASGTVNAQYLYAKDIAATGGATWNLVNQSVNQGNLSGWYVAHQQNAYYPGGFF